MPRLLTLAKQLLEQYFCSDEEPTNFSPHPTHSFSERAFCSLCQHTPHSLVQNLNCLRPFSCFPQLIHTLLGSRLFFTPRVIYPQLSPSSDCPHDILSRWPVRFIAHRETYYSAHAISNIIT